MTDNDLDLYNDDDDAYADDEDDNDPDRVYMGDESEDDREYDPTTDVEYLVAMHVLMFINGP